MGKNIVNLKGFKTDEKFSPLFTSRLFSYYFTLIMHVGFTLIFTSN